MIYFTSDLHLNHQNIIHLQDRPFDTVEEMNQILIDNINARVRPEDTLYLLGDISFRGNVESANAHIKKINCKNLYYIKGNHDRQYDETLFKGIYDIAEIRETVGGEKHIIVLCHYPMLEWNHYYRGAIHLHGHIHSLPGEYNQRNKDEGIRRYDVGVDANDYMPVSLQEILAFMKE